MVEVVLVDPDFNLVWEDRCNVFAYGIEQLFKDEVQFDVTLQIEGQQLKAHRHILSFCSTFFQRKFDRWPLKKRILNLTDVSYEAVKSILSYIYNGEAKVEQSAVPAFFEAVTKFGIDNLLGLGPLDWTDMEFFNSGRGDVFVVGFEKLFNKGKHFDVTIKAEGAFIRAHRNVLSVCSPYFQELLSATDPNEHIELQLPDTKYSVLKHLVHYMYHGEIIVKHDTFSTVLFNGEEFNVKGLERAEDLEYVRPDDSLSLMNVFAHSKIEYDHRKYDKMVENLNDEQKKAMKSIESSQFTFTVKSESESENDLPHDKSEIPVAPVRLQRKNKKNPKNVRKLPKHIPLPKLKKARKNRRITSTVVKEPNKQKSSSNEEALAYEDACNNNYIKESANEIAEFDEILDFQNVENDEYDDIKNGQEYKEVMEEVGEAGALEYGDDQDYDDYKETEEIGAGYMGYEHDDDTQNVDCSQETEFDVNAEGGAPDKHELQYAANNVRSTKRVPERDRVYNVVAEFFTPEGGNPQLVNNGHRYTYHRVCSGVRNWQCTRKNKPTYCYAQGYTKAVNGLEMAYFPPKPHNHHPVD